MTKDKIEKHVIAYESICNKIMQKKQEIKDLENKKKEAESNVLSLVLAENSLTLVDVLNIVEKYKAAVHGKTTSPDEAD